MVWTEKYVRFGQKLRRNIFWSLFYILLKSGSRMTAVMFDIIFSMIASTIMKYLFVAEKEKMAEIEAKIVAQGDKIRELKTAKAAKDVIQPEVTLLP